jgi:hypothetical protein
MDEVIQLDVFGGETRVVKDWLGDDVVVVMPPPKKVPTWWIQEELPLSSE